MKRLLCLLAAVLVASTVGGQEIPPAQDQEVQVAEVIRRGDMVSECGTGPRATEAVAYAAAMAPPADDSHLWNVTLWTTPNCQACEHLKSDFRKAPELLAFVAAPSANALPWAHYTEYSGADATQADRKAKYKITRFPTLVIQPPRNGMWGDPGLIVLYDNGGYSDAKALAVRIQKGVRYFAEVQGRKGFPKVPEPVKRAADPKPMETINPDAGGAGRQIQVETLAQVGVNPPFQTPPTPDPFNPQPVSPQPAPSQWPPAPAPDTSSNPLLQILSLIGPLLGAVLPSGMTLTWVFLGIQTGLWIWEIRAKKTPTLADDQAIAVVRSILNRLQNRPDPNATPPVSPAQSSGGSPPSRT